MSGLLTRRRAMMQSAVPNIPAGYTQVECLIGNGNQNSIPTGVYSSDNIEGEITYSFATVSDAGVFFGAGVSKLNNYRCFFAGTPVAQGESVNSVRHGCRFTGGSREGHATQAWVYTQAPIVQNQKCTFTAAYNNQQVTAVLIQPNNVETINDVYDASLVTGEPIYLFYGDAGKSARVTIYGAKIRVHSTQKLLFDGVPCLRDADNKPGFYDRVSRSFCTSTGTNYGYR